MIKFSATLPDGRKLYGVGLSRENCTRLLAGKSIAFPLELLGGSGELLIMAGETEAGMKAYLENEGMVIKQTGQG